MGSQTSQLLDAFDPLPAEEKRIFTAEFFRRAVPFDSGPLDDEETAQAADALFALLDSEEDDSGSREVRLLDLGMAEKVRPALILGALKRLESRLGLRHECRDDRHECPRHASAARRKPGNLETPGPCNCTASTG